MIRTQCQGLFSWKNKIHMEHLYKIVHYKTVLNIRQFNGRLQTFVSNEKCIEYIEKMPFYGHLSI